MTVNPQYMLIAKDIAQKIKNDFYKVGSTLKGRTLLSSEYGVSSETIRKAINLLENEKIVSVKHGVGIFIESKENVETFLDKVENKNLRKEKINDLSKLIEQRNKINDQINTYIESLIKADNMVTYEEIKFEEIEVPKNCWVVNQTIGDVYFYNYTEATIVAIKRNGRIITSPGPDFTFIEKDKLIIVGKDKLSIQRALTYLYYGAE